MSVHTFTRTETQQATVADRWFGLFGAALIACACAFAAWGTPPLPPAPLVLLGIPSPLTGMTRSFVALAGGHIAAAFDFHPLGPLCFAACALAAISHVVSSRTGRRPRFVDRILAVRFGGWLVAAAFVIVWVRQIVVFG